jgi:hypothetical protein
VPTNVFSLDWDYANLLELLTTNAQSSRLRNRNDR